MMPVRVRLLHLKDRKDGLAELHRLGFRPEEISQIAPACRDSCPVLVSGLARKDVGRIRAEPTVLGGMRIFESPRQKSKSPPEVLLVGEMPTLESLASWALKTGGETSSFGRVLQQALDRMAHPPRRLLGAGCELSLDRPRIMGILNVTPDSFSDGGRYDSLDAARRRAAEMAEEGADLIDIGGESTRPGAPPIGPEEELERVVPVVEALRGDLDLPLSIDTSKSTVAREAIRAGANFVNDISGLQVDPDIASVTAENSAGLFLMHMRGRPRTMQQDTSYEDLLGEIIGFLSQSLSLATDRGVPSDFLAIDPGIGFGKSTAGNLEILRRLPELKILGRPILLGTSRKSFIGRILNQTDPRSRLFGSLATVALGVAGGGQIFRVHDVGPSREAALMAQAICCSGGDEVLTP